MSATPVSAMPAGGPASRLGVLVFGLLVLASFAAFFLAQRLKHIPTAVQQLRLDSAFFPTGGGAPRQEAISFEIQRPDLVTVKILTASGAYVATLASQHRLGAYTTYPLTWNGRRGIAGPGGGPAGPLAPRGEYRVLVVLAKRKVEIRSPSSIALVRKQR